MDRRTDSEAGLYGANVLRLSLIAIISVFVFEFFFAITTLHIQVVRSARFIEAHAIATIVEQPVKTSVKGVRNVHSSSRAFAAWSTSINTPMDKSMEERIKKIISRRQDCYLQYNEDILKINVNCIFRTTGKSIEQIHELVSEVEKEIDMACPSAFVTIHRARIDKSFYVA